MSDNKVPPDGNPEGSLFSEAPIKVFDYAPPDAVEVDAAGVILPIAHQNGLTVIVPKWSVPSPDGQRNDLYIYLDDVEVSYTWYLSPLTELEFRIVIDPRFFASDGVVKLSYKTITNGNEAFSADRPLIISQTPVAILVEPIFPDATLWGYLNCDSTPKLWESLRVEVPVPTGIQWQVDDELRLSWRGFASKNGSGVALLSTEFIKVLSDINQSYVFSITEYERFIKPMEKNASALASYSVYRNGVLLGKSKDGLVKIDRVIPGENRSCGP